MFAEWAGITHSHYLSHYKNVSLLTVGHSLPSWWHSDLEHGELLGPRAQEQPRLLLNQSR